jgi:hypothetical protein
MLPLGNVDRDIALHWVGGGFIDMILIVFTSVHYNLITIFLNE